MSTSAAVNDELMTLESERCDIERFIPLSRLMGDDNSDGSNSAERYDPEFNANLQSLVGIDVLKGVVRRPTPTTALQVRSAPSSTNKLVEWEGVVELVQNHEFACRLSVIKGSDVDFEEFTTFDLDRVSEGDRDLVQPGALFRLVVGVRAISGTREQFSRLIFRRLPAWNRQTIQQAQTRIEEAFDSIKWSN